MEAALRRVPEFALPAALGRKEETPYARARIVGLVGRLSRLSGVEKPAAREVLLTTWPTPLSPFEGVRPREQSERGAWEGMLRLASWVGTPSRSRFPAFGNGVT